MPILYELKNKILWTKIENEKWEPRTKAGAYPELDEIQDSIDIIKAKLRDYLDEIKKKFNNDQISYAYNKKYVSVLNNLLLRNIFIIQKF